MTTVPEESAPSSTEVEPQVVVLSGPSGSGKSTVVDCLLQTAPIKLIKSISATTRAPRPYEVEGVHYYFLTVEDFLARKARGEFLECAEVHGQGNWYGTLRSEVQRAAAAGGWSLLEIDVQGALQVMETCPHALTIFLQAASMDQLEHRLRSRGTELEEAVQRRLATARRELEEANRYRYQVVNEELDQTVNQINNILQMNLASTRSEA